MYCLYQTTKVAGSLTCSTYSNFHWIGWYFYRILTCSFDKTFWKMKLTFSFQISTTYSTTGCYVQWLNINFAQLVPFKYRRNYFRVLTFSVYRIALWYPWQPVHQHLEQNHAQCLSLPQYNQCMVKESDLRQTHSSILISQSIWVQMLTDLESKFQLL